MVDRSDMVAEVILDGESFGVFYYPKGEPVYSADRIQRIVGVFDSRPVDASSDLLSWNNLSWESTDPEGTRLYVYVRSGGTEAALEESEWTGPFLNPAGEDIGSEKGRFLQIRIVLYSYYDESSEVLETPELAKLSATSFSKGSTQVFYTKHFSLGFRPRNILLTYNGTVPEDTLINFSVSGIDSVEEGDYQIITPNTIEELDEISELSDGVKVAITAVGSTDIPFEIDEFSLMVSGADQTKVNKEEYALLPQPGSSSSSSESSSSSSTSSLSSSSESSESSSSSSVFDAVLGAGETFVLPPGGESFVSVSFTGDPGETASIVLNGQTFAVGNEAGLFVFDPSNEWGERHVFTTIGESYSLFSAGREYSIIWGGFGSLVFGIDPLSGSDCNECDPKLASTYEIVVEDMQGDFAGFNGTWVVKSNSGNPCLWTEVDLPLSEIIAGGTNAVWLSWTESSKEWRIELWKILGCNVTLALSGVECSPEGFYSIKEDLCVTEECVDPETCSDSIFFNGNATVSSELSSPERVDLLPGETYDMGSDPYAVIRFRSDPGDTATIIVNGIEVEVLNDGGDFVWDASGPGGVSFSDPGALPRDVGGQEFFVAYEGEGSQLFSVSELPSSITVEFLDFGISWELNRIDDELLYHTTNGPDIFYEVLFRTDLQSWVFRLGNWAGGLSIDVSVKRSDNNPGVINGFYSQSSDIGNTYIAVNEGVGLSPNVLEMSCAPEQVETPCSFFPFPSNRIFEHNARFSGGRKIYINIPDPSGVDFLPEGTWRAVRNRDGQWLMQILETGGFVWDEPLDWVEVYVSAFPSGDDASYIRNVGWAHELEASPESGRYRAKSNGQIGAILTIPDSSSMSSTSSVNSSSSTQLLTTSSTQILTTSSSSLSSNSSSSLSSKSSSSSSSSSSQSSFSSSSSSSQSSSSGSSSSSQSSSSSLSSSSLSSSSFSSLSSSSLSSSSPSSSSSLSSSSSNTITTSSSSASSSSQSSSSASSQT
jgi:hypothetical protein